MKGTPYSGDELRGLLGRTLPQYMIPQTFSHLAAFPLNASGKLDRKVLASVSAEAETKHYEPPVTEREKALAAVISEVLGVTDVSRDDNFFSLGGDSIRAIYTVSELHNVG